MDAKKAIHVQQQDLLNMWTELWWEMAGGVKSEYERVKATDIFEFWQLFDLWKERTRREAELLKAKASRGLI